MHTLTDREAELNPKGVKQINNEQSSKNYTFSFYGQRSELMSPFNMAAKVSTLNILISPIL